ncbi:hypothetical protein [uncultured Ruthenibacterium sp.]|uniref:hypothetical protein n=1 Tax=uncultured Ruthenibacterium sp. TaxID=1905347 RepID=UPI00349ECF39
MEKQNGFWKQFESTGQIEDYLHYKKGVQDVDEGSTDANDHQRTGPALDKDQ